MRKLIWSYFRVFSELLARIFFLFNKYKLFQSEQFYRISKLETFVGQPTESQIHKKCLKFRNLFEGDTFIVLLSKSTKRNDQVKNG